MSGPEQRDVPQRTVMSAFARFAITRGRWLGRYLEYLGDVFGLYIPYRLFVSDAGRDSALWAVLLAAGYSISRAVGRRLSLLGRSLAVDSAADVEAKDRRPPVVLLRAFASDIVRSQEEPYGFGAVKTVEECIANSFSSVGPPIAVGRPNEVLRPLGFHRLYLSQGSWQLEVAGLVRRAALLVVVAGEGQGLSWEIEHITKTVEPRRIILFVPGAGSLKRFEALSAGLFPRGLLAPDSGASEPEGLIFFDGSWNPRFVSLATPWWRRRSSHIERTIQNALKSRCEELGLTWRAATTSWDSVLPAAFALAAIEAFRGCP